MPAATLSAITAPPAPTRFRRIRNRRRHDAVEATAGQRASRPGDSSGNTVGAPAARLTTAVLLSTLLHLCFAAAFAGSATYSPVPTSSPQLDVRLVRASPVPVATNDTKPYQAVEPAPTAARNPADVPTRAARFLAEPNLNILEDVPVSLPGSASLRLQVDAKGIVERVTLIRNDPAPKDLIDGLLATFAATRLTPALIGDRPVASSIDVTVRFEPGLLPIEAGPRQTP